MNIFIGSGLSEFVCFAMCGFYASKPKNKTQQQIEEEKMNKVLRFQNPNRTKKSLLRKFFDALAGRSGIEKTIKIQAGKMKRVC